MSSSGRFHATAIIAPLPAVVAAVLAIVLSTPVRAEVLTEIIVTAQKRDENVQDVGIAISTFTGDQMKALGVEDSFEIAAFVPGLHIGGALAGQNSQFTIRGVTQADFNDIVEAPNAVYLDEGYIAVAQAQTFALFDIERVEVLKGPQGTLFGRNATGGLVQYISRKPSTEEVEGYADVSYGMYDTDADPNAFRLEGAIGGPLTDTVSARVAGLYNDQEPYLENLYRNDSANYFGSGTFGGDNSFAANAPGPDAGADLADNETKALRGILQFEPSDDLRFSFTGNWADSEMATGPYQSKPTTPIYDGGPGDPNVQLSTGELINVVNTTSDETRRSICGDGISDCGSDQDNDGFPDDLDGVPGLDTGRINNQFQLTPGGDFFGYRDPDGDDWTFSSDFAFEDSGSLETWGAAFRLEYDLSESTTLTALTDFKDYDKLLFIDVDSAPVNQSANYAGVDATSLTQEVRLNGSGERTRWVAGVFYLNIDNTSQNGLKFPSNSVVPGPFDLGSDADLETNSYSLFGQGEYDLTETLTLVAGARFIIEDKDYVFSQNTYFAPDPRAVHQGTPTIIGPTYPDGIPTAFRDSRSDNLWAGKIQLDWRPTDDWLVYGGINRGVKAGSYNAQLAGGLAVPTSAIPYDEEVLLSYEAGFKSTWMDGRTRLNGSVYYYDYSDHQAFLFTGVGGVVVNSDANTIGAELEIQTSPIEGMDILLSGSWFDATVEDVPLRVGGPIVKDVDPTFAPEAQLAGLIRYEWALFGGFASVQGDFSYSDSFFYNLRNFDADQFDSYTLLNARIGWMTADESLAVALDLRNISDENAGIHGYDLATLCGCNEVSYRPPRYWGMNVKYSF